MSNAKKIEKQYRKILGDLINHPSKFKLNYHILDSGPVWVACFEEEKGFDRSSPIKAMKSLRRRLIGISVKKVNDEKRT